MTKDISRFLRNEIRKTRSVSTGSTLLDRAFRIPMGSYMQIHGEPYVGTTAIGLELAETFTKSHVVVYVDIHDSILTNKTGSIDLDNLVVFRPYNLQPPELISVFQELEEKNPIWILDNIDPLEGLWKGSWSLKELIRRFRMINSNITLIHLSRKRRIKSITYDVKLELDRTIYFTEDTYSELKGHLINVRGPNGSSKVYVDHATGRLSKIYEKCILEVEDGKSSSSVFKYKDIEKRGLWNIVCTSND